ncbi:MAG: hypothetical protein IJO60_10985 [Agathobacter sp.]|nr:hypothetical protein [Agathobacter sp.]
MKRFFVCIYGVIWCVFGVFLGMSIYLTDSNKIVLPVIVHDNMKYEAFGEWKKIENKVANKEYLIEKGKTVDV